MGGVLQSLSAWSKRTVGSLPRRIEKLRKDLGTARAQSGVQNAQSVQRATDLAKQIDDLLDAEECYWQQRSRVGWIKSGDCNTKLFHRKASWRAKKNNIKRLLKTNGALTDKTDEMEEMATEFFQNLYTQDTSVSPQLASRIFQTKVLDQLNDDLCKEFSDDEIGTALFQIGPWKAPGPDGVPARLLQKQWGLLKTDICRAVREFFRTGAMQEGVNDTTIVLIPKVKDPTNLKDFRPIGLCNVIYKIIAKCIVNRLRPLLQNIISPTQSAFIPGRLITNNALIAFECIHVVQKNNDSRGEFCAFKLDLAKAYDRVDWKYLELALARLGFAKRWINWIMSCMTTVRYSVRFNGKLLNSFKPSRGLRQGDPLSPYLFLLVAESLSLLLQDHITSGAIQELHICRNSPGISHLLFADDSLLFFKANADQAIKIRKILYTYESGTGQMLNPHKCSILMGTTVSPQNSTAVMQILEVQNDTFEAKYLGLPVPEGRMKDGKFQSVKEKM